MAYQTTFEGVLRLDRPLTGAHRAYLEAFARTRRVRRDEAKTTQRPDPLRQAVGLPVGPEGGFFVGAGGELGQEGGGMLFDPGGRPAEELGILDFNQPPSGQPHLWCCWRPTHEGEGIFCLEGGSHYEYVTWLRFLLANFLRPWGYLVSGSLRYQGEDHNDRGRILVSGQEVRREAEGPPCRTGEGMAAYESGIRLLEGRLLDQAIPRLRESVERAQRWADPVWALGLALGRAGRGDEGFQLWAAAIDLEQDPGLRTRRRKELQRILRLEGKAGEGIIRAKVLHSASRCAEALEEFEAYLANVPKSDPRSGIQGECGLAECLSELGRFPEALATLAAVLDAGEPNGIAEKVLRGVIARLPEPSASAADSPVPPLWADGRDDWRPDLAHYNLAGAYLRLGLWDGAIEQFQKALRLNANLPAALHGLGNSSCAKGDLSTALEAWTKACALGHQAACERLKRGP